MRVTFQYFKIKRTLLKAVIKAVVTKKVYN